MAAAAAATMSNGKKSSNSSSSRQRQLSRQTSVGGSDAMSPREAAANMVNMPNVNGYAVNLSNRVSSTGFGGAAGPAPTDQSRKRNR